MFSLNACSSGNKMLSQSNDPMIIQHYKNRAIFRTDKHAWYIQSTSVNDVSFVCKINVVTIGRSSMALTKDAALDKLI